MKSSANTVPRADFRPKAKEARSRVTNGIRLFISADGRTRAARRYSDLLRGYLAMTGGQREELCRQAASLVLRRELLDSKMVSGKRVNVELQIQLAGAINRTLRQLKERDPKQVSADRQREMREAGLV